MGDFVWGNEMQYLTRGMASYGSGVQLKSEEGDWFKESMRCICFEPMYLVKIQALEQAIRELYSIRNQMLGHVFEKMQKSGAPIYNLNALVRSLNVHLIFTEATMVNRKKCFKKAVERCQVDSLSSFVISCSDGQLLIIDTSILIVFGMPERLN